MAMQQTVTVFAANSAIAPGLVGGPQWLLVNLNQFNFGTGLITVFQNGGNAAATATYSVLVCGQDPKITQPFAPGQSAFGTIFGFHDTLKNLVAGPIGNPPSFVNFNSSLQFPCTAVALYVTALTAGASVSLSLVQTF